MAVKKQGVAIALGIICHSLFIAAVSAMGYMLFWGMTRALIPLGGALGKGINVLLTLQFPLLHSYLLSKRGAHHLRKPFPDQLGKDLMTTSFAAFASLQLLVVFLFWTPIGDAWFVPRGGLMAAFSTIHALSWVFLFKALYDAGLSLQTGYLGWSSVVRGAAPRYPSFPKSGLFRLCRQPIYFGFFAILLTAPVWSIDHLLIFIVWGSYCVWGAKLKEKRFLLYFGEEFRRYQEKVPFFLPALNSGSSRRAIGN